MRPLPTFTLKLGGALALAGLSLIPFSSALADTGPTVTITSTASSTTSWNPIPINITFSEPVTGLSSGAIHVSNGAISGFSGFGSDYFFSLAPGGDGPITVSIDAGAAASTASSTVVNQAGSATFTYDTTPPAISLTSGITSPTASATPSFVFNSNEAGTLQLFNPGCTASNTNVVAGANTVTLNALSDGDYFCWVQIADAAGNVSNGFLVPFTIAAGGAATSTGSGDTSTSTPSGNGSEPALSFDSVDTIASSATADGSFADGWKWMLHFTVPDSENMFRLKFGDFTNGSGGVIPAAGNIRISSSAQSANATSSDSAIVSQGNDYGGWLTLTGDSSTNAGRQVDLLVEVAVPSGTSAGSYSTSFSAQSSTTTTP